MLILIIFNLQLLNYIYIISHSRIKVDQWLVYNPCQYDRILFTFAL
jgi:hypothetical protein